MSAAELERVLTNARLLPSGEKLGNESPMYSRRADVTRRFSRVSIDKK